MPKRSVPERVQRVQSFLFRGALMLFTLAGLLFGNQLMALLCLLAVGAAYCIRPAATAVVRRRVSLWAVLGDDVPDEPVPALPAAEEHQGPV